MVHLLRL